MEFNPTNLLHSDWINALGTTLFHSLWIGMIMALITSFMILLTRKSTANLRYNLLSGILSLFVLTMIYVYYDAYTSLGSSVSTISNNAATTMANISNNAAAVTSTMSQSFIDQLAGILHMWSAYTDKIVICWFLIICAKSLQMTIGLNTIGYLKRTNTYQAGTYWETKVANLASMLEVSKPIRIMQSAIIKVPMMAGHLKPVILLPLGMLNGLSVQEVEAILAHEIAHIKRSDYLINILQGLVEIAFFFNPGVLWISKLIKEERENCCDDLALQCTESKHQYISALISCQKFQSGNVAYAMAITGRKGKLMDRVSRMVFNKTTSLNKLEKTGLTLALLSVMIFTAAFTQAEQPKAETAVKEPAKAIVLQDTSKKSTVKIIDIKNKDSKERPKKSVKTSKTVTVTNVKTTVSSDKGTTVAVSTEASVPLEVCEDITVNVNSNLVPPVPPVPPATSRFPMKTTNTNVTTSFSAVMPASDQILHNKTTTGYIQTPPTEPQDMTQDLLKDGLVDQVRNISYKLNNEELVINGKVQSPAVHQKYLKKYLKNKKGTITTKIKSD